MKLRNMTIEDLDKVAAIEAATFSVPWSRDAFEGSLLQENYRFIVAASEEDEGDVLGYCCFYHVMDEAEIPIVCVRNDKRRMGIGEAMLGRLIECAAECDVKTMFLEVRKSNEAARNLYRKAGFEDSGIRKGFYECPREDAVVMRYVFNA